jgi:protocatechuate 3,4-dioxygenase beta subunit
MSYSRTALPAKVLLLSIVLLCKSVISFAHRVQLFNTTGCTAGSTVTITPVVTSAPSNTYYNWQYKDNTGTWKFFAASSTINGTVFTVTGFQNGPAANNAGTLTIANATSALEDVQIRVLMSEDVRPINANSNTPIWGGDDQEPGYAKMLRLHIYNNASDCGGSTPGCLGNLLTGTNYYGGFEAKTYSTSNGSFTDNNFGSGIASTDFSDGAGTSTTPSTSGTGTYYIWNNPYAANHNNTKFAPHTGSFQMIIQSASNMQKRAWYKTVTVTPGSIYNFSVWVARTQSSNAFNLKLTANGSDITTSAVSGTVGLWTQIAGSYTVPAGVSSIIISISDVSTSSARYYSLDDICFTKVISAFSLGNNVWYDINNNAGKDANEPGLAGVPVKLYDCSGTYLNQTAVTDANGAYQFTNLAPGSYIVGITPPTGYTKSDGSVTVLALDNQSDGTTIVGTEIRTGCFSLTASTNNIDFGLKGTGGLGDFVWNDKNGNGIQDAGEPGIANAPVILTYPDNVTVVTTNTDANGSYSFTNLAPGNYKVQFTTPDGWVPTKSNTGSDDTKDSDPAGGIVTNVPVVANASNLTVDAGFFVPMKLGNFVWYDKNNNGTQDANEPGVAGVTVALYADENGPSGSVCGTAPEGTGLTLSAPAGTVFTSVKFASYGTPAGSCGSFTTGGCHAANSAALAGAVFLGQNTATIGANNNVFGDPCGGTFKALSVELNYGAPAIATAITNATGNYIFSNLAPGKYTVAITVPAGYQSGLTTASSFNPDNDNNTDNNGVTINGTEVKSNSITLVSGDEPLAAADGDNGFGNLTLDFGLKGTAALGDFVWNDLNRNGLQDAGEPGISGASVTLTYPDGSKGSGITDQNGGYNFTGLVPGTYSVTFSTPANGFTATLSNANANGSDLIDSDPAGGNVNGITLAAGETNNSIDAGFFKPINIYGNVWHDANAMDDGQVNKTSNTPIPNTLVVYLVDDATGLVVDGYSIGQNGTYEFDNVQINHVYRLILTTATPDPVPTLPTGWFNTGENQGAGPFSGNDGQTDGRLFIETDTNDVHDANFGIRLGNGEIIIG